MKDSVLKCFPHPLSSPYSMESAASWKITSASQPHASSTCKQGWPAALVRPQGSPAGWELWQAESCCSEQSCSKTKPFTVHSPFLRVPTCPLQIIFTYIKTWLQPPTDVTAALAAVINVLSQTHYKCSSCVQHRQHPATVSNNSLGVTALCPFQLLH